MAPFSDDPLSAVPTLAQKHSGIPENLLQKAQGVKKDTFEKRTKPRNDRQRLPVIPQGISSDKFFEALDELRMDIGVKNVELNDQPLQDGWQVVSLH